MDMLNLNSLKALIQSAKAAATAAGTAGNGELNKKEAQFVNNEASQVQNLVDAAMADGFVDNKEMAAINKAAAQLGRDLNRLEHNFAGGSVDGRQDNTARRADAGTKDGSLTADESSAIAQKQASVDALIANARLDGKVTAAEQKEINAAQRGLSKDIYSSRHNDQGTDLTSRTIDGRQSDLRSQVDAAVQGGVIDGTKYGALTMQLQKIDQLISGAKADGWVDPAEGRAIRQAQAQVEKALGQGEGSPAREPR
ncbi:MAG TPA: hypothetical protein VFB81_05925 [Myxococcales bacterium]|nr:hypothetical protein [Myxococcales bacterium]